MPSQTWPPTLGVHKMYTPSSLPKSVSFYKFPIRSLNLWPEHCNLKKAQEAALDYNSFSPTYQKDEQKSSQGCCSLSGGCLCQLLSCRAQPQEPFFPRRRCQPLAQAAFRRQVFNSPGHTLGNGREKWNGREPILTYLIKRDVMRAADC